MKTIYSGEVQLQRWSDTSSGGATITLWLPDGDDLANFKLLTERKGKQAGQILAMVIKTVDVEDEQAITKDQKQSYPFYMNGPLCRSAIGVCKNKDFQRFVDEYYVVTRTDGDLKSDPENEAKQVILQTCFIESRKELDTNDDAARRFAELMQLYRAWIAQNGE
jgi:endogenous inhibitor of DNA gyrase (YacG/DUF329 family)